MAPLSLKLPVAWWHSSLRYTGTFMKSERLGESSIRVSRTRCLMRSRAMRASRTVTLKHGRPPNDCFFRVYEPLIVIMNVLGQSGGVFSDLCQTVRSHGLLGIVQKSSAWFSGPGIARFHSFQRRCKAGCRVLGSPRTVNGSGDVTAICCCRSVRTRLETSQCAGTFSQAFNE